MLTLRWVRCRNFRGVAEVEARFPAKGAFLLEGPNEAGKTSLFDAVRYALTGLSPQAEPPQNLVAYGQSDAYVAVEGFGPGISFVIEREISRSGFASVRMSLDEGLGRSEHSSESEAAEALRRMTGLSPEGLYAAAFVEFDRPGRVSEGLDGVRSYGFAVPIRTELEAAATELQERGELPRLLEDARQVAFLAEAAGRSAVLQRQRSEAERGLALARLRQAHREYEPVRAGLASLHAAYAELESTRLGLRRRLEAVERRSATQALVDAIRASKNAARELRAKTEAVESECDAARSALGQAAGLMDSAAKMRQAMIRLAAAREWDSKGSGLRARLEQVEAKVAEIEELKRGGADAGESRAELTGTGPDGTMPPALPRDATAIRMGAAGLALAGGGIFLVLFAPQHSAAVVAIALSLLAAGVVALAYGAHALARRGSGAIEGAGVRELRENRDRNVPAMQRAGPRIQAIEAEIARVDIEGLREGSARAGREAESARAEAAELVAGLGIGVEGVLSDAAIRDAEERARKLEIQASELERLEQELQPLQLQAVRIRDNERQRLDRLRDLWPDFAWQSDSTADDLEVLVEMASSLPPPSSAISLGRELAQVSARLAALDPLIDEAAGALEAAREKLIEAARPCGLRLDPETVEAGLAGAVADVATLPEGDEQRTVQKLEELNAEIQSVESQVGSLEASLGRSRFETDPEAAKADVESIERQIEVRRQAVAIAAKAQAELGFKAVSQALRTARLLLPAFTGQRYFDLRLGPDGEIQLWDEEASTWAPVREASAGLMRQVHLAMRLAAAQGALAPATQGSPAFLFLDDPGAGADLPRRRLMAAELATGTLRDWFRQVFVFAVEGQMDRRSFDWVVAMEEGRISAPGLDEMAKSAMGVDAS